jgi:uncharacterized protein (DUF427 family)
VALGKRRGAGRVSHAVGHRSPQIVVWEAVWNDTVVAEARHLTRMNGRQFFPLRSVHWDLLREAGNRPGPSSLGPETTFDVVVDNLVAHHGARCYRDPALDLLNIKNLVTFGPDVVVRPVRRPAPIRARGRWHGALSKMFPARPASPVDRSE